jgi:hypothetical protein
LIWNDFVVLEFYLYVKCPERTGLRQAKQWKYPIANTLIVWNTPYVLQSRVLARRLEVFGSAEEVFTERRLRVPTTPGLPVAQ